MFLLIKMKKQGDYNNLYKTKVIFTHTRMFPITYFLKESQCWSERNPSHIILKSFARASQHWKELWSQK